MESWKRYAVYYTATGALADFGASWLGWDVSTGQNRSHPVIDGLAADQVNAITKAPRRYGFHATLKPPFRLNADTTESQLITDLTRLASDQSSVSLGGGLRLAILHGFPALIPSHPSVALTALASRLVRELDHHRQPLTSEDYARRNPDQLNDRQRAYLAQWGYPWVMEEFRFHMTLGGRLPASEHKPLMDTIHPILTPLLPDPHPIDAVTLVGEDADGYFHQIERFPLMDTIGG